MDLIRLVTEGKSSSKLIKPYAGELLRKLTREMVTIYRSIENGFTPNLTPSLTQASSTEVTPAQAQNNQGTVVSSSSRRKKSQSPLRPTPQPKHKAIHMQQLAYYLGFHRIKRAVLIYHSIRAQAMQYHIWMTGHLPTMAEYTGIVTRRRKQDATGTPKPKVNDASSKKRQLDSPSAANAPKRVQDLASRSKRNSKGSPSSSLSKIPARSATIQSSLRAGNFDVSLNLSPAEVAFGNAYQLLIGNLCDEFPMLDIMGSLEPPKEVFTEVRVIRECGDILTANGVVTLEAGTQLFVRKADVEQFLRSGDIKKSRLSIWLVYDKID